MKLTIKEKKFAPTLLLKRRQNTITRYFYCTVYTRKLFCLE